MLCFFLIMHPDSLKHTDSWVKDASPSHGKVLICVKLLHLLKSIFSVLFPAVVSGSLRKIKQNKEIIMVYPVCEDITLQTHKTRSNTLTASLSLTWSEFIHKVLTDVALFARRTFLRATPVLCQLSHRGQQNGSGMTETPDWFCSVWVGQWPLHGWNLGGT